MPVLARTLESAGLATILVTMMPFWAERVGTPRTLAVEFPFGQTLGKPHDVAQQMRVILQALEVLEEAEKPGTIMHSPEECPVSEREAMKAWQPEQPSPIIAYFAPRLREMVRQHQKQKPS